MLEPQYVGASSSLQVDETESSRNECVQTSLISREERFSATKPDLDLCLPSCTAVRHSQLDVLRTACACWVVGSHVYRSVANQNPLFVLNWVMQYLSLTSGVTFAMSRQPIHKYYARLLLIFILGSMLNAIPVAIRKALGRELLNTTDGPDAFQTIFAVVWQFWYIPVLIVAALLMSPLKWALHQATPKSFMFLALVTACACGAMAVWTIALFADGTLPVNAPNSFFAIEHIPLYALHTCGHLLLAIVGLWCIQVRTGRRTPSAGTSGTATQNGYWLGWMLICYTYMLVVVMEVERVGQFCIFAQLMISGLVLYHAPLKHRARLQHIIHATWPLLLFVLYFASVNLYVTVMHFPRSGIVDRARCAWINITFVAIFGLLWCPCMAEKTSPDTIGVSWVIGHGSDVSWMSTWSLLCYVIHVAMWDMALIVFPHEKHERYVNVCVVLTLLALALPCNPKWRRKCCHFRKTGIMKYGAYVHPHARKGRRAARVYTYKK